MAAAAGRVTIEPSAARPGRYRLRIVGGDGGELSVTPEVLEEIVERGSEALNGPSSERKREP